MLRMAASHTAVMSGVVATWGRTFTSARPVAVALMFFFLRSMKLRSKSVSMMAARVAGVPMPSASDRIFLTPGSATYRAMLHMAWMIDASVKGLGGWVCLFAIA